MATNQQAGTDASKIAVAAALAAQQHHHQLMYAQHAHHHHFHHQHHLLSQQTLQHTASNITPNVETSSGSSSRHSESEEDIIVDVEDEVDVVSTNSPCSLAKKNSSDEDEGIMSAKSSKSNCSDSNCDSGHSSDELKVQKSKTPTSNTPAQTLATSLISAAVKAQQQQLISQQLQATTIKEEALPELTPEQIKEEENAANDPDSPQKKDDVYKCRFCDRTFCYLCHLRVHERVHTGEKPYKCSFCDVTFSQLGSLTVHMRIHTGEKPYECRICKKKFRHINSLRRHQRQVHRKQPGDEDTDVITTRPLVMTPGTTPDSMTSGLNAGNPMLSNYSNLPVFGQSTQQAQQSSPLALQQQLAMQQAANVSALQQAYNAQAQAVAAQQAQLLRQKQAQQIQQQLQQQQLKQLYQRSLSTDTGVEMAKPSPIALSSPITSITSLQNTHNLSAATPQELTTAAARRASLDQLQKRTAMLRQNHQTALLQLQQAAVLAGSQNNSALITAATKRTHSMEAPASTPMAPPAAKVQKVDSSLVNLVKMIEKGETPDMSSLGAQERKQMKLKLAKYVMNVLSEDDDESKQIRKDFEKRSNSAESIDSGMGRCNSITVDQHVDVV